MSSVLISSSALHVMSEAGAGFPVVGLKVSATSVFTLDNIAGKIPKRVPEAELLCLPLLSRLRLTHDAVAALPDDDKTRDEYCRILVRFVRLLMQRPLLQRLASSSVTQVLIQELHRRLDAIFETLGVEDSTRWRAEWDAGCDHQLQELKRLASRSPFVLANEVGGDKKLKEILIKLSSTFNSDQDPELLELRRDTFDRVIKAKRVHGLKIFDWFISGDDIDYEDEAIGAVGTFAIARRGTWFHGGERQDVVVKTLFFNTEGEDEDNFHRQLTLWYGLSDHPNVLKLKGGNPFSQPPFFVCENAPNGNLLDFLADKTNEGLFWSLFLDVARGIQYLHSQRIVHGSLKAVNILVTSDNTAKIADFGFSRIRSLSLNLSDKGSRALAAAIRWKPKEMLEESDSDGPQFASDLYAFGMSMLEVIAQEPPFGTLDDDAVTDLVLDGKLPERPEQASDAAWDLILKLCAADFHNRPGIDDVIDTLTSFQRNQTPWRQGDSESLDDVENPSSRIAGGGGSEGQDATHSVNATLSCPECDSKAHSGDSHCRTCGFFLETDAVFA